MLEINIKLSNNKTSLFRVVNDNDKNSEHLDNCLNLATVVSKYKANTFRRNRKDKGNMYILGNGQFPNGKSGCYKLTSVSDVTNQLPNISNSAQQYYEEIGYKDSVDEIIEKRIHPIHPSMDGSFVSSIVVSCNLINSFHVDVNDASRTILTWVTNNVSDDVEWYFILTNVTRDYNRAIVLKIVHGLIIDFDSTLITHCSTSSIANESTKLCGIAFVAGKD